LWWRRPPAGIPLSDRVPGRASGPSTSRELLIASLLITGALVFYEPVVKIPSTNTSIFAGGKSYRW
jgi:hypothetical protein